MNRYDALLQPLIARVPRSLRPNHLALLRILLILPLAYALIVGLWPLAAVVFILASALDLIDGPLARARNQVSMSGAMLDPIADKLLFVTTFILLGFTLLPVNLFLTIIMVEGVTLFGAVVTSSVWHLLYREEPQVDANRFGKYKTACYFIATLLLILMPHSATAFKLCLLLYYVGLLFSIISMVRYNLDLAKKS